MESFKKWNACELTARFTDSKSVSVKVMVVNGNMNCCQIYFRDTNEGDVFIVDQFSPIFKFIQDNS